MYFIKTGILQVVSPDGKQVYATLKSGAAFGEISILDIPGNKNGNKRTANIRSLGFSDVFKLTKTDLWMALTDYPLAKEILLEKGKTLLRKDNLLDENFLNIENKKKSLIDEIFYLKKKINFLDDKFKDYKNNYKIFLQGNLSQLNNIEACFEKYNS
jgi:cyclic nucleotide gated channel alpha 3